MLRFLSFLLALGVPSLHAEPNWNQFRGPGGVGVVEKSELAFPLKDTDLAWKVTLEGAGHSSPVTWGERIFLTAVEGQTFHVLALELGSGKELWKVDTNLIPHPIHRFNNMASSTPVVDAAGVYVLYTTGKNLAMVALSHDGAVIWKREDLGEFFCEHGSGMSPVMAGGNIVFTIGHEEKEEPNAILALNPKDGKTVWRVQRKMGKVSFSTPLVVSREGREEVIVAALAEGLTSVDAKDGSILWTLNNGIDQRSVGSPVSLGNGVFATFGSGGGGKQAIVSHWPDASGKATLGWEAGLSMGLPYVPCPLVYQGKLYLISDGGVLSCVNAADGKKIYEERVGRRFYSSPVCVNGWLVCCDLEGKLFQIPAKETFEAPVELALPSGVNATPVVAGGLLLIRTQESLMAFGKTK